MILFTLGLECIGSKDSFLWYSSNDFYVSSDMQQLKQLVVFRIVS